ncbi:MAG: fibronectin type III domain-containing protein [Opitutales bacterium]
MDSPYHNSTGMLDFVRVKPDGTIVLLGSGRIHDATTLEQIGALGTLINDAVWLDGNLITLSGNVISSHSSETYEGQAGVILRHTGLRLFSTSDQRLVSVCRSGDGDIAIDVYHQNFEISPPAVLAKPKGLSAAILEADTVRISWKDIVGESGFRIEQRSSGTDEWEAIGETGYSITTFQDTAVAPGPSYRYRVVAVNGLLESDPSDALDVSLVISDIPAGLAATTLDGYSIQLDWEMTHLADGYALELRPADAATWIGVSQSLDASATSSTISELSPNTAYEFRLRSFNALGNSDWVFASAATEKVRPAKPFLFDPQATPVSVFLSWSQGNYAEETVIERLSGGSEEWHELAIVPLPTSSFIDTTVQPSTTYTYRIQARNTAGGSFYSSQKTVDTPALSPPQMPVLNALYPESSTSLSISWQPVPLADAYQLDYRRAPPQASCLSRKR